MTATTLTDGPLATVWMVEHVVARLDDREAYVLRRHLAEATDGQIAAELGVHRSTVVRVRHRATADVANVLQKYVDMTGNQRFRCTPLQKRGRG